MHSNRFFRRLTILVLGAILLANTAFAQGPLRRLPSLAEDRFKNGSVTLAAFASLADSTRDSIVKLSLDGDEAALGTIVDSKGLVITKASEVKKGKLTCTMAGGTEVEAELIATNDDTDIGLVQIKAEGLKPIKWAPDEVAVGQWVVTPGIGSIPEAVGIVSVAPRRILPKRAMIGVRLDTNSALPMIAEVAKGMGAEKAGIRAGDIVAAVDGQEIKTLADLPRVLREYRDGQTVKLTVLREDYEFDANIVMLLEEKAPQEFLGYSRPRGRGSPVNRAERMNRMGTQLSERADGFERAIQHDTVLEPWQCGGPLINIDGRAVGLNIARAGRVITYALPADLVRKIIDDLEIRARAPVKFEKPYGKAAKKR